MSGEFETEILQINTDDSASVYLYAGAGLPALVAPNALDNSFFFGSNGEILHLKNGNWRDRVSPISHYFKYVSDESTSLTNSESFIKKLELVTDNLETGNYKISVNYGWNHSNKKTEFIAKVNLNAIMMQHEHCETPPDSKKDDDKHSGSNQRFYISRVFYKNLTGINTISLEFATSKKKATSSIFDTSIEILRI